MSQNFQPNGINQQEQAGVCLGSERWEANSPSLPLSGALSSPPFIFPPSLKATRHLCPRRILPSLHHLRSLQPPSDVADPCSSPLTARPTPSFTKGPAAVCRSAPSGARLLDDPRRPTRAQSIMGSGGRPGLERVGRGLERAGPGLEGGGEMTKEGGACYGGGRGEGGTKPGEDDERSVEGEA